MVANSFLAPGNPGFYSVVARTAATLTSGNQNVTVSIGGLTSNVAVLPLTTGGAISSVTNGATYTDPSLPSGAIAQGSIAIAKGKNLGPASIVVDSNPFQNTSLSGTSVAITVGGTTAAGLMYYTSFAKSHSWSLRTRPRGRAQSPWLMPASRERPRPSSSLQATPGSLR